MLGYRLPPRGLLALIGAITIVPLAILLWLGWQLLEQDRTLESQQRDQQRSAAADRITAALERSVAAAEQRLASGASDWSPDAVTLTIRADRITAEPRRHVAFLPVVPSLPTPRGAVLDELDAAEYRAGSLAQAVDRLTTMSRLADRPPLRLARVDGPCVTTKHQQVTDPVDIEDEISPVARVELAASGNSSRLCFCRRPSAPIGSSR